MANAHQGRDCERGLVPLNLAHVADGFAGLIREILQRHPARPAEVANQLSELCGSRVLERVIIDQFRELRRHSLLGEETR